MRDSDLPFAARVELKTLSKENAEFVARHLFMASSLIDTDPALAHEHALSASRRGGRIAMVRESLAITAYTVGDYALALRELRTYRRISGRDDEIALMVDCERGLGRPDRALELGRSVDRSTLETAQQVQLAIAMSGARLDQGQAELALVELEIPQLDRSRAFTYSPALFGAYAEVLDELGRADEAEVWRRAAERAENALAAAAQDEYETVDVLTEHVEGTDDEDADSDGADDAFIQDGESTGFEDAEDAFVPDAGSEGARADEAAAAEAAAAENRAEVGTGPVGDADEAAGALVGVKSGAETGEMLEASTGAPGAAERAEEAEETSAEPAEAEWDAPADLQAQIQAEYDELIAEIERAADDAAALDGAAGAAGAVDAADAEPEFVLEAEPAHPAASAVSSAAATVEEERPAVTTGAEDAAPDDDQPSLFDL